MSNDCGAKVIINMTLITLGEAIRSYIVCIGSDDSIGPNKIYGYKDVGDPVNGKSSNCNWQ